MKVSANNVAETIAGIEDAWKSAYPGYLCRYRFMDQMLDRQYGSFKTIFTILGLASFLSIFIGCLGLYGLVSFMSVQRTKEIGIRKVLGATVSNILLMFTKESTVLICIAFVVAAPLAYFAGMAMLMELPERVTPGINVFIVTICGSLLIAWLAVGYQSLSAARQNPVDSLRNE
jgi:ABC-type antimicrobial peptide transport system permease subunit